MRLFSTDVAFKAIHHRGSVLYTPKHNGRVSTSMRKASLYMLGTPVSSLHNTSSCSLNQLNARIGVNHQVKHNTKYAHFTTSTYLSTRHTTDSITPIKDDKEKTNTVEPQIRAHKPSFLNVISNYAPGVLACAVVMQIGTGVASNLGQCLLNMQGITGAPSPISAVPIAIVTGMIIGNTITLSTYLKPGLDFTKTRLLQAGVVCVGAKLSAMDLLTTGLLGLPCVAVTVGTGLTFIPWLARRAGLTDKMGSLIAAGTSICGVTAISAVSPAIKASPQETSVAVANVVAFGTLGMLTYPYLAHAIFSSSQSIGVFLGLAVHDTSQVLGSALTYSTLYGAEDVLKIAAVTKLTRNVCLAGVVPYMSYKHAEKAIAGDIGTVAVKPTAIELVYKYTPGFVAGFIAMACMRSTGDYSLDTYGAAFGCLSPDQWKQTTTMIGSTLSQPLLTTAMAGVGLTTSLSALKGVGYKPFAVGFTGATTVGLVGLTSALVLGVI